MVLDSWKVEICGPVEKKCMLKFIKCLNTYKSHQQLVCWNGRKNEDTSIILSARFKIVDVFTV